MFSFRDRLTRAVEGTYEIERELGSGTSAVVFLARSVKHDRRVAIKVLRPEMAAAVGSARFLREIETAAKMTHPHILPLLDSNEAEGLLYLVTPYIEGESLRERIDRDGSLEPLEAIRLTSEVASALQHAHARGIIHRDIKPENILLQDGRAIVADFGISLPVGGFDGKRLTESGLVIGTPWYMSPEQISGSEQVDARTDIYSLGCVLYELLVGKPPFAADNPRLVLHQQLSTDAVRLRQHLPSASSDLEATVAKALMKDPNSRFTTAREFGQALEEVWASSRVRLDSKKDRTAHWRWVAAAIAILALVIAGYAISERKPVHASDWLVVADFDGPPADPELTVAFRELVTAELNQSHFVRIVPRQQLNVTLRDAGLPETTTVNSDLARELAFRSAVRGVVSGTIRPKDPGDYDLTIRVVDADRGTEILAINDEATRDNVMSTIASLAATLRSRLGERRSAIRADRPLLDIATPSLPAYRSYVDALGLRQRGDLIASNRALSNALARDTGFASAWALLGMNYVEGRHLESARAAMAEALRRPARLSDASRYRLQGDAAYAIDYDLEAAVRWYGLFLKESPHSIGGRNNYGLYLSLLGRREEALGEFTRASSENPLGPANAQTALLNESLVLTALGRRDRAEAVARDLIAPFSTYAQLQIAHATGELAIAESLATATAMGAGGAAWLRVDAVTTLAAVSAARGQFAQAQRRLAAASVVATDSERRWYSDVRALLAFVSGEGAFVLDTATAHDSTPGGVLSRGLAAAVVKDTVALARDLGLLRARSVLDSARLGQGLPVLQGLLDDARGDGSSIVAHLGTLARNGETDGTNLDRIPAAWSRWLVSKAYASRGQPDLAILYLRMVASDTGLPSGHLSVRTLLLPFVRRELGRDFELIGQRDSARSQWTNMSAQFANPDARGAQLSAEGKNALSRLH